MRRSQDRSFGASRRVLARSHAVLRPSSPPSSAALQAFLMLLLLLAFLWLGTRAAGAFEAVTLQPALQFSDGRLSGQAIFSPAESLFASTDLDGAVRLYDTTGRLVRLLKRRGEEFRSLAFSPDGRYLLTGSSSGRAYIWTVGTGECRLGFTLENGGVDRAAWLANPDRGVLGTDNGLPGADSVPSIVVFNIAHGRPLDAFHAYVRNDFHTICVSEDGTRMALLGMPGQGGAACVVDTASGRVLSALRHPDYRGGWISVCLSADGKMLATGHAADIVLWDLATGTPIRVLKGHTGWVVSLAFSPDGHMLASGSRDGTARVWDLARGTEIGHVRFDGARIVVNSVSFSPDGSLLLAATWADHVLARIPKPGK